LSSQTPEDRQFHLRQAHAGRRPPLRIPCPFVQWDLPRHAARPRAEVANVHTASAGQLPPKERLAVPGHLTAKPAETFEVKQLWPSFAQSQSQYLRLRGVPTVWSVKLDQPEGSRGRLHPILRAVRDIPCWGQVQHHFVGTWVYASLGRWLWGLSARELGSSSIEATRRECAATATRRALFVAALRARLCESVQRNPLPHFHDRCGRAGCQRRKIRF
jgi:hypothetical protein